MYKVSGSKLSKIMALDMKRGIADKIFIIIEMVLCIILISLAFTGVTGANFVNKTFKSFSPGFYIDYSSILGYDAETGEHIHDQKDKDNIAKIVQENKVIQLDIFDRLANNTSDLVYSYSTLMLEHIDLLIYKGNTFSEVDGSEKEILLKYEYKDKYQIGESITGEDLGTLNKNQRYKVIGYLKQNYAIIGIGINITNNYLGIVKHDAPIQDLTSSLIMTDLSRNDFIKKYDLENKPASRFTLKTIDEYINPMIADQSQINSFMLMFTIIALLVYFSSIISAIVIKHNNVLQINVNAIKIGATKEELLFAKCFNIAIITLLSAILGGIASAIIIPMFIAIMPTYATLSMGIIALSIVLVVLSYVVFELLELAFVYNHIKRGK